MNKLGVDDPNATSQIKIKIINALFVDNFGFNGCNIT
jgi:hypothetical protein